MMWTFYKCTIVTTIDSLCAVISIVMPVTFMLTGSGGSLPDFQYQIILPLLSEHVIPQSGSFVTLLERVGCEYGHYRGNGCHMICLAQCNFGLL